MGPPGASCGLSPGRACWLLTSCSSTWRSTAVVFREVDGAHRDRVAGRCPARPTDRGQVAVRRVDTTGAVLSMTRLLVAPKEPVAPDQSRRCSSPRSRAANPCSTSAAVSRGHRHTLGEGHRHRDDLTSLVAAVSQRRRHTSHRRGSRVDRGVVARGAGRSPGGQYASDHVVVGAVGDAGCRCRVSLQGVVALGEAALLPQASNVAPSELRILLTK
jgi:hypothetical protein